MFNFKHFKSLQWFGFLSILSLVGLLILKIFTSHQVPLLVSFFNVILAGLSIVFIEWPSKDGYSSGRAVMAGRVMTAQGVVINPADGRYSRFNPIEGKSAEEIIYWFQKVVDVELNDTNYTLALNTINLHLINNNPPFVKSVLDDLEGVESLKAFAIELKKNLL